MVGQVDLLVEGAGRIDGAIGVSGQVGRDLEGNESVRSAALIVEWAQHCASVCHVVDDHGPVGLIDGHAVDQTAELVVVVRRTLDGLLKDGRVGGHPPNAGFGPSPKFARQEVAALQVVEPRTLTLIVEQLLETGIGAHSSSSLGSSS